MNIRPIYLLTGAKVLDKENEGTQMNSPIYLSIFTLYPFLPSSVAKEGDIYRSPQLVSLALW